jgi:hypothetical protein
MLRTFITLVCLILISLAMGCGKSGDSQAPEQANPWELRPGDKDVDVKGKPLSVWIKQLKSSNEEQRIDALQAIGSLEARGEPAVAAIVAALKDPSPYVQPSAAFALVKIGPTNRVPVPTLMELMFHENGAVGGWAISSLGKTGPAAKEAVPTLSRVARERSGLSWEAWKALRKIDRKVADAIPNPQPGFPLDD